MSSSRVCLLLIALGCDSGTNEPLPTFDSGPPPIECDPETLTIDTGHPDGHADPLMVPAGQSRAGRLEAGELPPNPDGLLLFAPGDFVILNEKIAVLIEDAGESDLYDPWGGKIIGIARVEGGRLVDPVDFNEIIFGLSVNVLETESVTVMDDGSDGSSAVIRATGELSGIPFISEFPAIDSLAPGDYSGVRAAIDYVLEPGSEALEIYLTFVNERGTDRPAPLPLHAFFQDYRMPAWHPGTGFDTPAGGSMHDYAAFVQDDGLSYAWESADGPIESYFSVSGFDAYSSPLITFPACTAERRRHARLTVGGPGLDGIQQAIRRLDGASTRTITGTVLDAAGMPAAGVRVHAEDATMAHVSRVTADDSGAFTIHVPNGPVTLRGYRRGEPPSDPVAVATDATTAMIRMPPSGLIHVVATDDPAMGMAQPLPVRVQVIPMAEVMAPPDTWGERRLSNGRLQLDFAMTGESTLRAPPGRHQVVVSRGYEYEVHTEMVDVVAGGTVEVTAALPRVVDTTGIMCGDFHIHTHRSPDSGDHVKLKIAGAIADGLEIPVRTEHEFVAGFEPVIAEMGLGAWAYGVAAEELTTFQYGHFNVGPLVPDPSRPNAGALPWVGMTPPEVFDLVRARPESPVLIINHPRAGGGFGAIGAYFDAVGYDPVTGTVEDMSWWDEEFEVVEVFNDSDFRSNFEGTVRDWFSFLNQGRRVYAVGSSDSHSITGSPVGYPRTCMYVETDNPRSLTPEIVRDAAGAGRSTISGGIYVHVEDAAGMYGPGEVVAGAGLRGRFRVSVQAASWIDVDRVRIFVDGMEAMTIELTPSTPLPDPMNPVLRFQDEFEIDVATMGTWVVAEAEGDDPLEPVHPGRMPFGVTNPLFFQR